MICIFVVRHVFFYLILDMYHAILGSFPYIQPTRMLCSSEFQNLRTTGDGLLDLQAVSNSPADVQSMSVSGTKRPRANSTPALLATHRMHRWPTTTELRWWGVFWSLTQKKKMKVMITSMVNKNLQRLVSKLKPLKPWMLPKAQRIWSHFHKRRWSWTSRTQEMWIEKIAKTCQTFEFNLKFKLYFVDFCCVIFANSSVEFWLGCI